MEKIKNAIIIHGPGRSGTTLLNNILSLHSDMFWISSYLAKHPSYPILSILNNFHNSFLFEKFTRKYKKIPRPTEAYSFWIKHLPNFNKKTETINRDDISKALNAIEKIKKYTKGSRFIFKITGSTRIEYIDALFDNPTIIWIDRKPQSVVMSYFKQKWKYKRKVNIFNSKPKKELIREYSEFYKEIFIEKDKLKYFDFHQVFYEDLVNDKISFFSNICQIINVNFNEEFKKTVKSWDISKGTNNSYKKHINKDEELFLNVLLNEYSKKLGYN